MEHYISDSYPAGEGSIDYFRFLSSGSRKERIHTKKTCS